MDVTALQACVVGRQLWFQFIVAKAVEKSPQLVALPANGGSRSKHDPKNKWPATSQAPGCLNKGFEFG